jgi:hypothetical protein
MKHYLLPLLILLSACGSPEIAQDEEKGIAAVVDFYGGSCGWSKGYDYQDDENIDYFELNISGSDLMDKYADKVEMPASNAAYLFYSQLGPNRTKYSDIRVNVELANHDHYKHNFKVIELKEVARFTPYVALLEQLIDAKDYTNLWATFDEEIQASLSEEIIRDFFEKTESEYGSIRELQFQGFRFSLSDHDRRPVVHLACVAIREKENTPLSLFLDRKTRKLMGMQEQF